MDQPFVVNQPQSQPQQVVYIPVAAAPAQCPIKEAELKVEKASKRVRTTSKVLMALGVMGVFCALIHGWGARDHAERIISGKKPWDRPPTREERKAMGTHFVTRDELELYDLMKGMSYLMFLISVLVIGMGKCGLRVVWREKSKVGKRVMKKSGIMLAFIAIFGICMVKQGGQMKQIKKQYKKDEPEEYMGFEDEQRENRYLEFFSVSSAACAYSDADSCDADSACTWCKSAAVASSCKDINDAKALPPSIFSCDKI